eukprot:CAMPEP_0182595358 /NCGR_PEP_ID=MMETSP1324-20130603/82070_1 /TAXON_ID=236786 /ORGANISM="Florenciella sp., Strain RCC1587" /LENGTH=374 /DNA_ID=CAMNT_0024812949 /DNA_START=18 /DNA_END=1138 /DNA_ORIENTATION=-
MVFHKYPNVLPYQRTVVGVPRKSTGSAIAGYVIRQHFYTNLYDRLSTRPFLSLVEKKWIVFQLFKAVEQCHQEGVCHGDIKSENIMVTSWSWIVLTDFASFKPTYLPDDDPTDFNYYFASSEHGQHRCYLAPERFYSSSTDGNGNGNGNDGGALGAQLGVDTMMGSGGKGKGNEKDGPLHQSMDVFSLGCVIAEVFLGGDAVLDLPTLLQYRSAPPDVSIDATLSKLNKIEPALTSKLNKTEINEAGERGVRAQGESVKNLVCNMLQREPSARKSVAEYRDRCETKALDASGATLFPPAFSGFIYPLMVTLQHEAHTPDERVLLVCQNYGSILWEMAGLEDPVGEAFFAHFVTPKPIYGTTPRPRPNNGSNNGS